MEYTVYEAAKGRGGMIIELFRKVPNDKWGYDYEEFIRDKWVENEDARAVFFGYGTCTFRVSAEEAKDFVDAMRNGTIEEYYKNNGYEE